MKMNRCKNWIFLLMHFSIPQFVVCHHKIDLRLSLPRSIIFILRYKRKVPILLSILPSPDAWAVSTAEIFHSFIFVLDYAHDVSFSRKINMCLFRFAAKIFSLRNFFVVWKKCKFAFYALLQNPEIHTLIVYI